MFTRARSEKGNTKRSAKVDIGKLYLVKTSPIKKGAGCRTDKSCKERLVNTQLILTNKINSNLKVHIDSLSGFGVYERQAIYHFVKRGKKVRSLTFLLTYLALTNRPLSCSTINSAIAMASKLELIHRATLILDDITDSSLFRNGSLSLVNEISSDQATKLIDTLIATVCSSFAESEIKLFSNSLSIAFHGHQVETNTTLDQISVDKEDAQKALLWIIETKSGALAELCLKLAFEYAKTKLPSDIREIAINLAYSYQLMNDIADLDPKVSNGYKLQFEDLKNRRVTLPIFLAAKVAKSMGDSRLEDFYLNKGVTLFSATKALLDFCPKKQVISFANSKLNLAVNSFSLYLPHNDYSTLLKGLLMETWAEQYMGEVNGSVAS
jgi:geranylgeranyl pyrophosphate synthase